MRNHSRRGVALLLCLIMCFCLFPTQAFAAEDQTIDLEELAECEVVELLEAFAPEESLQEQAEPVSDEPEATVVEADDAAYLPVETEETIFPAAEPAPFQETAADLDETAFAQSETLQTLPAAEPSAVSASNGWTQVGGKWYYYRDGSVLTGWQKISGVWYYFNPGGEMVTGWQRIGGRWYYFKSGGAMVTGWKQISGVWYYFTSGGAMVTGWKQIDGRWYYFTSGGAMVTGWKQISNTWYYFTSGGAMAAGWQRISNTWYYFNPGGAMVTGWKQIDEQWYYFNAGGAMVTGWKQQGGNWSYLAPDGAMASDEYETIDGKLYYFDPDGVMMDLSPDAVYQRIIAQKDVYYEGRPWTNENEYVWTYEIFPPYSTYTGGGCVAFAMIMSDAAFGKLQARKIDGVDYDTLRPGDILRMNGNSHSVILLQVYDDHVVIAEGNYNSSIHWGRELTRQQVEAGDYIITRYPET